MRHATSGQESKKAPFVVFALPRSRTAWLSRFLTYGEWTCGHEELRHMRSLDDVQAWFSQDFIGTIETAAAAFWRLLPTLSPDAKVLVIRRNREQVIESLMSVSGVVFDRASITKGMIALDRKLDQIEARFPCMSVDYADLEDEGTCASIFEYCLPYKHDHDHWQALSSVNIQMDMRAMVKYVNAFRPQLSKLGDVAKHRIMANLSLSKPVDPTGVTIQIEPFDVWIKDARHLIKEHLVRVGESPEDWQNKNLELMKVLDDNGCMQLTTARSNGRIFGYLMTLISPSLTSPNVTTATNLTHFASDDMPGLGMKLQRHALRSLKERGVDEVFFEAGKRASGPRISAIYKRLGAIEHGQTYRLDLKAAA